MRRWRKDTILSLVLTLATVAHSGRMDKAGRLYTGHPPLSLSGWKRREKRTPIDLEIQTEYTPLIRLARKRGVNIVRPFRIVTMEQGSAS